MANLLQESIDIVFDFIRAELALFDADELESILNQLNEIAINPSLLLNERDRLLFETAIENKYDADVISLLNDTAMDLYMRLESTEAGLYSRLTSIVEDSISLMASSSLVPSSWKQNSEEVSLDIGQITRLLLGYVVRDFTLTDGDGHA